MFFPFSTPHLDKFDPQNRPDFVMCSPDRSDAETPDLRFGGRWLRV